MKGNINLCPMEKLVIDAYSWLIPWQFCWLVCHLILNLDALVYHFCPALMHAFFVLLKLLLAFDCWCWLRYMSDTLFILFALSWLKWTDEHAYFYLLVVESPVKWIGQTCSIHVFCWNVAFTVGLPLFVLL